MAAAPFSEEKGGLPLWRLQVEDPLGAAASRVETAHKALALRQGGVLALVLKLYDGPGRPLIFHQVLASDSEGLRRLRQAGAFIAVFERKGFMGDAAKRVELDLSGLGALAPSTPEALSHYMKVYRRLGNPEAAWAELEAELSRPPAARKSGMAGALILLLLAAAAAAAWWYFKIRKP